ncbi:MAG: transcription termination/antitermination NusG family protein, partial [Myxococcota bacterium]
MSEEPVPRWYALAVHARQEKAAAAELEGRGFQVLLPLKRERRLWSDRVQTVELALFPGYLFVHTGLSAARRVDMLKVRQTYDLVGRLPGDERIATPVGDEEIASIQTLLRAEREMDPVERLVRGTRV